MSLPFVVGIHVQIVLFQNNETLKYSNKLPCCTSRTVSHTGRKEFFSATGNVYSGRPTYSIFGAAGQKTPGNVLVDFLIVTNEISRVICGVDGRMRFIIILPFAGLAEAILLETKFNIRIYMQCLKKEVHEVANAPQLGSMVCF